MTKKFKFNTSCTLGLKITKSLQFNHNHEWLSNNPKRMPQLP